VGASTFHDPMGLHGLLLGQLYLLIFRSLVVSKRGPLRSSNSIGLRISAGHNFLYQSLQPGAV
jgi:hypothetical protein